MQRKVVPTVSKISVALVLVGVFLFGQFWAGQSYEWHELLWMLLIYLIGAVEIWMSCFTETRLLTSANGRDDWYTITAEFVMGSILVGGYVLFTVFDDLL
ncbi:MAG: hypothetical protein ABF335_13370 [Alphaproteobacteria bacterium]